MNVEDDAQFLDFMFKVVKKGPLAFTHARLKGEGVIPPEVGDWVIVKRYAGLVVYLRDVPLRFCNDDDILAVVPKPEGWRAHVG